MFSADIAYDRHHCYLADGFHQQWLANISRVRRELPVGVTLHPGHGEPCGTEALDWQERLHPDLPAGRGARELVRPRCGAREVVAQMLEYLPSTALQFLMELSIDPLADELRRGRAE